MSMGKIIGGGCLGLIVLFAAILGIVFYATSGITDAADDFFAAVESGDYEEASQYTSQRLQDSTTPEELREYVEANGLDKVVDTTWSSRSIENSTGEISGTVETEGGGTVPMTILFVSEQDEWRIDGFDIQSSGLSGGSASNEDAAPGITPELRRLAAHRSSFHTGNLALSLERGDFSYMIGGWVDGVKESDLASNMERGGMTDDDLDALSVADANLTRVEAFDDGRVAAEASFDAVTGTLLTKYVFQTQPGTTDGWKILELDYRFEKS